MLNQLKTLVFLAVLTALFLWLGQMIGGQAGMVIAFVLAAAMNIGMYWFSDRIVLRMYKAREVTAFDAPALHVSYKSWRGVRIYRCRRST
jgi:heat shock protein HtpX